MPTINSHSTKSLFDCLLMAGIDASILSQESGLDYAALQQQDHRVPLEKHVQLWHTAGRIIGSTCPEFALQLGVAIKPEHSGIVGNVFMQAANLLEAATQVARYSRLIAESDQWQTEEKSNGIVEIVYRIQPAEFYTQYAVERVFATAVTWNRYFLQDDNVHPLQVCFKHDTPVHLEHYQRLFQCPLIFGADDNRIQFCKKTLERPNPQPNHYLQQILIAHADRLQSQLPQDLLMTQTVKDLILATLPSVQLDMAKVADHLGLSRKTLYRRLKAEGSSFQMVFDQARKQLAAKHLSESMLSVEGVAFMLGFAEASSFHRACKRWFGLSPKAIRNGAR